VNKVPPTRQVHSVCVQFKGEKKDIKVSFISHVRNNVTHHGDEPGQVKQVRNTFTQFGLLQLEEACMHPTQIWSVASEVLMKQTNST